MKKHTESKKFLEEEGQKGGKRSRRVEHGKAPSADFEGGMGAGGSKGGVMGGGRKHGRGRKRG